MHFCFPVGHCCLSTRFDCRWQLSGKAHEDSDYTVMIAIVHCGPPMLLTLVEHFVFPLATIVDYIVGSMDVT